MKGLLLKDFYSVRTEYKMYGIMLPFLVALMFLLNMNGDGDTSPGSFSYLVTYAIIAAMGLTMNTFTYDEKISYMQYALATTVTRKSYLAGKYMFHLLNSGAGALLGLIAMLVLSMIMGCQMTFEVLMEGAFVAGGGLLAAIVAGVWQIGLSIRFDSVKARLIFVAMIVGVSLLAAGVIFGLTMLEDHILLIVAGLLAVVLLFTIWMFCMSFVWAERKEF